MRAYLKWPIKEAIVLPQNSPIKLNLTQPRPYPRCQSFFVPVVGSENWGSGDDVQTSIFSPELSKHCSRNRHSSIWQHFAPFLHITAPRAVMSNYENKQIPQKTGLATYLISKSHGSAVGNCRDQRMFFPLVTRSRLRRSISQPTTGKKTLWHPGYPDLESPEKSKGQ